MKAAASLLMLVACACATRTNHPIITGSSLDDQCAPVADTLLSHNQSVEGLESRYRLVLVREDSLRTAGRSLTGLLYLWRASPNDSNTNGEKPPRSDAARSFYIGTTDVNLEAAEADYSGFWRKVHNPKRSDIDPLDPPILGIVHRGTDGNEPWLVFWLSIGSLMNGRHGRGGTDGAGVVLDVKRIDSRGLFGTWGPAGIVRTGKGHFCAYRDSAAMQ